MPSNIAANIERQTVFCDKINLILYVNLHLVSRCNNKIFNSVKNRLSKYHVAANKVLHAYLNISLFSTNYVSST